jgi:hypothetical protein
MSGKYIHGALSFGQFVRPVGGCLRLVLDRELKVAPSAAMK